MFKWFRKSKQPTPSTPPKPKWLDDDKPWGSSFYISAYRAQLEEVAIELTRERQERVQLSYNIKLHAAEFHTKDGIIARVNVHGECGAPYASIVRWTLSDSFRDLFIKALPYTEFEPFSTELQPAT